MCGFALLKLKALTCPVGCGAIELKARAQESTGMLLCQYCVGMMIQMGFVYVRATVGSLPLFTSYTINRGRKNAQRCRNVFMSIPHRRESRGEWQCNVVRSIVCSSRVYLATIHKKPGSERGPTTLHDFL